MNLFSETYRKCSPFHLFDAFGMLNGTIDGTVTGVKRISKTNFLFDNANNNNLIDLLCVFWRMNLSPKTTRKCSPFHHFDALMEPLMGP